MTAALLAVEAVAATRTFAESTVQSAHVSLLYALSFWGGHPMPISGISDLELVSHQPILIAKTKDGDLLGWDLSNDFSGLLNQERSCVLSVARRQ